MRTIYVSGYSDDLIEVEGDVQLEAAADTNDERLVQVNGVDLLKVRYDDEGLWRVSVVGDVPGVQVQVHPTVGEDIVRVPPAPVDVPSYSDYAVVSGDITSVCVGEDSWPG